MQVKSTATRSGAGYLCQFHPNHKAKRDYSLDQIDIFAAYVIPENAWYLIPAVLLLGERRKRIAMLCPLVRPKKRACYCYECYRENWDLLKKSRNELLQFRREPAAPSHHKKRTSSPSPSPCQGSDGKGRTFKPVRKSGVDLCGRYPASGCPILSRFLRKGGYHERRPQIKIPADTNESPCRAL